MKLALRLPLALGLALALVARRARGNIICGTEAAAVRTCLAGRGENMVTGPCAECLFNGKWDHDAAAGCVATGAARAQQRDARPEPGGDDGGAAADGACAPCKADVLALNACSVDHQRTQRRRHGNVEEDRKEVKAAPAPEPEPAGGAAPPDLDGGGGRRPEMKEAGAAEEGGRPAGAAASGSAPRARLLGMAAFAAAAVGCWCFRRQRLALASPREHIL